MKVTESTHHYSKFVSLLENFGLATEASNVALNSQGSALRENEKYMDSIAGRMAVLKTTVESKWNDALSSDTIKGWVTGIQQVVESSITLGNVISSVVLAFVVLNREGIVNTVAGIPSLIAGMRGVEASAIAVKGASIAANAALGFIAVASVAFTVISAIMENNRKKAEALTKSYKDLTKTYEEQRAELGGITSFYEKNASLIDTDTSVRSQLLEMQRKLIEAYGDEARSIDLVNGKYEDNIQKLTRLNRIQLEREVAQTQTRIFAIREENYSDPRVEKAQGAVFDYIQGNALKYVIGSSQSPEESLLTVEEYYQKLDELRIEYETGKIVTANDDDYQARVKAIDDEMARIKPRIDVINSQLSQQKALIKQSFFDAIEGTTREYTKMQKDAYDTLMNIGFDDESKSSFVDRHNATSAILDRYTGGASVEQTIKDLTAMGYTVDQINTSLGRIPKNTGSTPLKNWEDMAKGIKTTVNEIKNLNSIQDDLAKGNSLSSESLIDLATNHRDLLPHIKKTADGYTVEAGAIDIVKNAMVASSIAGMQAEMNLNNEMRKALFDRLGIHILEIKSIDELNKARGKVDDAFSFVDTIPASVPQFVKDIYSSQKADAEEALNGVETLIFFEDLLTNAMKRTTGATAEQRTALDRKEFADEAINAYNVTVMKDKLAIKSLETQIKTAEKAKDYNTQLRLTNELMAKQKETVNDLITARNNMHAKADDIRKNAKSGSSLVKDANTDTWFDADGNATSAYGEYYNSMAGKTDKTSVEKRKQTEALFDALQRLKKAWISNSDAVVVMGDAIDASAEKINQINLDKIEKSNSLQQKMMDLRRKQYQDELDDLQDAHDKTLEKLDDELEKYEDIIDKKITALDRLHNAEDYDRDISKKDKKIMEVQSQIDALSMDNSSEAVSRRAELLKQLTDMNDEKDDTIRKHAEDAEKESLQNMLSAKKESIDDQKELENDKFKVIDDNFKELMKDENLLAQTSMELLKSTSLELIAIYGTLFTKFEAGATSAGKALKEITIDSAVMDVIQGRDAETEKPDSVVGLRAYLNSKGYSDSQIVWKNGGVYVDGSDTALNTSALTNTKGVLSGTIKQIQEILQKAGVTFKSGGYTGDAEGMAYLHKKELILNAMDTENFLKAIDVTRTIADKVAKANQYVTMPDKVNSHIEATFNLEVHAPEGTDPLELAKIVEKFVWDNMSRKLEGEGI